MLKVIPCLFVTTIVVCASNDQLDFTSINKFALQLLDHSYAYQENFGRRNFAISPISVWKVFSLLTEGSSGDTFNELVNSLHLPNEVNETQLLHAAVDNVLRKNSDDVILNSYSAVFADKHLELNSDFCKTASGYSTDIFAVDAKNTSKLADDINYVICKATQGKITEAVKPETVEKLVMILIDALYFKSNWTYTFKPTHTQEVPFYNAQGQSIGTVNMMYHEAPHNIIDALDIEAQVLEMTYGTNKDFSMMLLLPFDGVPLKKMLNNLATKPLQWFNELRDSENITRPVECFIPRFKISCQVELTDPLKYSGIHSIFDSGKAQLPGVSSTPLYVSKALQNVNIDVNESGTVAAVSTVVGLITRFGSPTFEANREFAFMILDRRSNIILFSGVYTAPSLV